jgi:hypothetical protein
MIGGAKGLPPWIAQITGKGNYVASPGTQAAYGVLIDGDKPPRWFGAPDAAMRAALTKLSSSGRMEAAISSRCAVRRGKRTLCSSLSIFWS